MPTDAPARTIVRVTKKRGALEERFWAKVDKRGPEDCWLWTAYLKPTGYGEIGLGGRNQPMVHAHRVSYEIANGPIPEGLVIDHLCRVRNCVNPAHLEAVTNKENLLRGVGPSALSARKTHCSQGHPYDEGNTYTHQGTRHCKECYRLRNRQYYHAKKVLKPKREPISHCLRGHLYDEANTYWLKGKRYCRECKRVRKTTARAAA